MKIDSLYISAFGGLKDYRLDLSDGFNLLYGNNEDGKSTLMAFIKMMFYGSERGSALNKNLRKKYTPWDGSAMAGSIDFTLKGKKYRLEKEFRSSNSTDRTVLVDLALGERQPVASDIGVSLIGLSAAAFERSVFIGQFGFPEGDTAAQSELNSKLSNIALTGDEAVSFDTVYSRLQKARLALMSKSGRAGSYDKNLVLLNEANRKLELAAEQEAALLEAKNRAEALKSETEELAKSAAKLKERLALRETSQKAEKLQEYLSVKKNLDGLNNSLRLNDGGVVDEMFLRSLKFCFSKFSAAQNAVREKENQIALIEQSLNSGADLGDATPELKQKLEAELINLEKEQHQNEIRKEELESAVETLNISLKKQTTSKKKGVLFLSLGLSVIVAAVALGIFNLILPACLCGGVGLVIAALGIVFMSAASKLGETAEKINSAQKALEKLNGNDLQKELFEKRVRLEMVATALQSNTSVIEKQKELLKEGKAELSALLNTAETEKAELVKQFTRYKPFVSIEALTAELEEISAICERQKEIKNHLNFLARDLGNISYSEAESKLEELKTHPLEEGVDYGALKREEEQSLNLLTEKRSELSGLLAEIKAAGRTAENPEAIKKQIAELTRVTENQKEFCDTCDLAMTALTDAYSKLRSGFGSALEATASENFKKLSGDKYSSMSVSDSFKIAVTESGSFPTREIEYLSSGAADQAYLSLRIAIASLMTDGEALPILLDDALAQYDDTRLSLALNFLKEYSDTAQIILFTCHRSICDMAESLGAKPQNIKE